MKRYVVVLTFDDLARGRQVRTFGPHALAENAERARRRIHYEAASDVARSVRTYVAEIEKEAEL